jgi:hypothetical protein
MHAKVEPSFHPVVARLAAIVGDAHVLTDLTEREFYSTDIYRAGKLPCAVVRPASTVEVSEVVKAAAGAGLSIVARGGGASYTDGYAPAEPDAVLIDSSRLNRIVEVNERDGYVVVQAGVTWAELNEVLKSRGLRTPFFGPFSGIAATVGGSLSQGHRPVRRVWRERARSRGRDRERRRAAHRLVGRSELGTLLPLVRPRLHGPVHGRLRRARRQDHDLDAPDASRGARHWPEFWLP